MKKFLFATLLLVCLATAGEPDSSWTKSVTSALDSLKRLDSALGAEQRRQIQATLDEQHVKDSVLFATRIPDSLRAKVLAQATEFIARKAAIDAIRPSDTADFAAAKAGVDSLRKDWEARRDSQVSKIVDTEVKARIKVRLAEIARRHAEAVARIEARKAKLQATVAEVRARIAEMKPASR